MTIILAGDVGGTKTILGIYTFVNNVLLLQVQEKYESSKFKSFNELLQSFLSVVKVRVDIAVFACAGPILDRSVHLTNLKWKINADNLEKKFCIDRVELINDLQGIACAVPELSKNKLFLLTMNASDISGNKAVLAPGTGLGMATLVKCRQEWHAVASEGGHADFAPVDELQIQLLLYLSKGQQCDIESVLSGQGILNIYNFLKKMEVIPKCINNGNFLHFGSIANLTKPLPKSMRFAIKETLRNPTAADISAAAIAKNDELSMKTMEVFVSILARTASNLALKSFATGGVYLAGGIVPKILPLLKNFSKQFCHKGKMQHLLKKIPVFVVMDERAALMGAALYAKSL
ncbi:MAG: glucokinase [Candidatus Aenigmarchaeota archaeon]|nr:glucokinase [Candidatus Aenigmarchaeota archaeon]